MLISSCAAAVLLCSGGVAQAQPAIIGGGSTLASVVYPEMFAVYSAIFAPGTTFTYVADGSGSGQAGFLNNQPETHGLACGTDIHFGASDATLSASPQISTWNASSGGSTVSGCTTANMGLNGNVAAGGQGGPLIQVPTFGTTIAIPYNTPGQPNNGQLQFTDDQLCGIFSGRITLWTDPLLAGIATTGAAPTGTIFVTYRSDGSGTSFLLTQHLHAVCNSTNLGSGASNLVGGAFTASTTFASNFVGSSGSPLTIPLANFHPFSGSGGVQGAILANSGSTGYLSPDFTLVAPVNIGTNGANPPAAKVKNTNDGNFYLPTGANGKTALGGAALPTNPADPTQFVPAVANPLVSYPIVGYTTWDVAQCYANASVGEGIRRFLSQLYNSAQMINLVTVNGFSPVPSNLTGYIFLHLLSSSGTSPDATSLRMQDPTICQSEGASGAGTFAGR